MMTLQVNYCALTCGVAPMSPGAQGSVRALLVSWRPKIICLPSLASICGEGRQQEGRGAGAPGCPRERGLCRVVPTASDLCLHGQEWMRT